MESVSMRQVAKGPVAAPSERRGLRPPIKLAARAATAGHSRPGGPVCAHPAPKQEEQRLPALHQTETLSHETSEDWFLTPELHKFTFFCIISLLILLVYSPTI